MEVLIIGGTGLISTGITRQLVDAGHDVTIVNRGESDAEIPDSVTKVTGDRTDYDRFEAQMADLDVECVIDMVGFVPEDARSAVRAFGDRIEQYIFCSTIDVYHRPPPNQPVREGAPRHPPVSEYGENKAICEDIFVDADEDGAFAATIIRPWSTYGEGGSVLHTFGSDTYYVDRLRRGKPIVVHGDGTSLWSPCHRDDVAGAFVGAVDNETAYGEAYHVTSEESMTWNQYHHRVADALGAPEPELVHVPTEILLAADPDRTGMLEKHFQYTTVFDNSKAQRDLGFEYTIAWEEGVRRTVAWLEEHDEIRDADDVPFDDRLVEAWRRSTGEFIEEIRSERSE